MYGYGPTYDALERMHDPETRCSTTLMLYRGTTGWWIEHLGETRATANSLGADLLAHAEQYAVATKSRPEPQIAIDTLLMRADMCD